MWDMYEETGNERIMPNVFTYSTVIKSWCDQNEPAKAEELLEELLAMDKRKDIPIKVNRDAFELVIAAWVDYESNAPREDSEIGCERAENLLNKLIEEENNGVGNISTSPEIFNAVLKATAVSSSRSMEVFDIALRTFKKLESSYHTPNNISYRWLLRTGLSVLTMPSDDTMRRAFLDKYIKKCCDDGMLCRGVVRAVANCPVYRHGLTIEESSRLVNENFGDWPISKSWSSSVPKQEHVPAAEDFERYKFDLQPQDYVDR